MHSTDIFGGGQRGEDFEHNFLLFFLSFYELYIIFQYISSPKYGIFNMNTFLNESHFQSKLKY